MTRRLVWTLGAGLAVMTTSALTLPIIPLYDGVGFPDQPYRYSPNAHGVEQTTPVADLTKFTLTVQTTESGPQFIATFDAGQIALPAGAYQLDTKVAPAAPTAQPGAGRIAGNVYIFTATSRPGPPSFKSGVGAVSLRLPQGVKFNSPPAVIYRSGAGKWQQLNTLQTGSDIYTATFNGPGEYALSVTQASGKAGTQAATSSPTVRWLLAGIAFVVLILIILAIRNGSKRARDKHQG
jgi:hypothetical protein